MEKSQDRRKHVLIDQMQYRLLKINVAYFVVIFATFMTSLFAPLVWRLLVNDGTSLAGERAAQQFLLIDETVWLPLLLTFLCLITHSVFVSHRIAGPLVRLRRVLGAVGDGDLTVRATLRQKDYLMREQAVINDMIARLASRIGAAEETAEDIRVRVSDLRTAVSAGGSTDVLDVLAVLDNRVDKLGVELREFSLPSEGEATEAAPRGDEATDGSGSARNDASAGPVLSDARAQ